MSFLLFINQLFYWFPLLFSISINFHSLSSPLPLFPPALWSKRLFQLLLLSCFFVKLFKAIHLSLRTILTASHMFWYVVYHCSSILNSLYFPFDSLSYKFFFESIQVFKNIPVHPYIPHQHLSKTWRWCLLVWFGYFYYISKHLKCLIALWSGQMLCRIPILWNSLKRTPVGFSLNECISLYFSLLGAEF